MKSTAFIEAHETGMRWDGGDKKKKGECCH